MPSTGDTPDLAAELCSIFWALAWSQYSRILLLVIFDYNRVNLLELTNKHADNFLLYYNSFHKLPFLINGDKFQHCPAKFEPPYNKYNASNLA